MKLTHLFVALNTACLTLATPTATHRPVRALAGKNEGSSLASGQLRNALKERAESFDCYSDLVIGIKGSIGFVRGAEEFCSGYLRSTIANSLVVTRTTSITQTSTLTDTQTTTTTTTAQGLATAIASLDCHVNGFSRGGGIAFDAGAALKSFDDCKKRCISTAGCVSFRIGTGICKGYRKRVQRLVQPDDKSPYFFYDVECPLRQKPSNGKRATAAAVPASRVQLCPNRPGVLPFIFSSLENLGAPAVSAACSCFIYTPSPPCTTYTATNTITATSVKTALTTQTTSTTEVSTTTATSTTTQDIFSYH